MKKNVKLVAGLATTLALVGATGVASGFAWLTTNASVSLSYSKMTLTDTGAEVEIEEVTPFYNATVSNSSATGTTVAATSAVSDVSSADGINFYKPVWAEGDNMGLYVAAGTDASGATTTASGPAYTAIDNVIGANNGYTSVLLELHVTPHSGSFNLEITEIDLKLADEESTDANDANLLAWSRVAINVFTAADGKSATTKPTLTAPKAATAAEAAVAGSVAYGANELQKTLIVIDDTGDDNTGAEDDGKGLCGTVAASTNQEGSAVVNTLPALGSSITDSTTIKNVTTVKDSAVVPADGAESTATDHELVTGISTSNLASGETYLTYYVLVTMWMEGTNGNQNSAGGGEIALDLTIGAITATA